MAGYKERQIIHVKDVFQELSNGSHAWAVDVNSLPESTSKPNTTRTDPLAAVQVSDDKLLRVNGTMSNGEQLGSSYAKKPSKKKRPAPRPPESNARTSESRGQVAHTDTETRTVLAASPHPENITSVDKNSTVISNQLSPQQIINNRPVQPVASGQNNAVTQPSTSGIKLASTTPISPAPDQSSHKTSMSWASGKENRAVNHRSSPAEEPIYLPGSVCLSETGTIASSGYQSDIMKDTMTAELADGDNSDEFEEEGFCIDFDEEDEGVLVEGKHTHVYQEFEGEDFSQYLEDDSPENIPTVPHREGKKRKGKAQAPLSPTSSLSVSSEERTISKKSGLRQKISKVFTMSRSENKNNKTRDLMAQNNSIHNFTFSDSKLGNLTDDSEINDPGYKQSHAGMDSASKSDVGASESHWWNTGTLSARGKKNVMESRSTSVPNMLEDGNSYNYKKQTNKGVSSSPHSSKNSTTSSRKSGMYEPKDQSVQAKKSNIWKKFTKSLRGEQNADFYGVDGVNKSQGGLTESQNQDIRL